MSDRRDELIVELTQLVDDLTGFCRFLGDSNPYATDESKMATAKMIEKCEAIMDRVRCGAGR